MDRKPKLEDRQGSKRAFEKVAEYLDGWRKQEEGRLDSGQKKKYEALQSQHKGEIRQYKSQFFGSRRENIAEEKRRIMLMKPSLAYRMFATEPMKERRAQRLAVSAVYYKFNLDVKNIQHGHRQQLDQYLHDVSRQREQKQELAKRTKRDIEKSSISDEWRKQEEKKLNNLQRKHYDGIQNRHRVELERHETTFRSARKQRVLDERTRLIQEQSANNRQAQSAAETSVDNRHQIATQHIQYEHRRELDGYLHHAAEQRVAQTNELAKTYNAQAKEGLSQDFNRSNGMERS